MAYDWNQRFNRTGDSFLLQDADLRGGWRVVNSIAERDAIPLAARKLGMVVRVLTAQSTTDYTLPAGGAISNAGWREVENNGGGGGTADGIDFVVAKMQRQQDQVVYSVPPLTTETLPPEVDPYDVPPEVIESYGGALCFNNGYENTIEINVHSGQIVARREVALSSDVNGKEDIQPIEDALDKIDMLEGITFNRPGSRRRYTGLRAQDVLKALPEAVTKMTDGTLAVFYGSLIGLIVQGVKKLRNRTDIQAELIKEMQKELAELRQEIRILKGE